MRQLSFIAAAICALGMGATAEAQTRFARVWIDVSAASAMAAEDSFAMTVSVARSSEQAEFGALYHVPRSVSLEAGGGFMLTPKIGIGLSVGGSAHEERADLAASLPHPYFLNAFASAAGQTDIPMQRIERHVSLQAMLIALQTRRVRVRAFGGPSYFRIQQDSVTDITYHQFYFVHSPTNVAELTDYEFARIDGSGWGFHVGADGTLFFTHILGVAGFASYSRGTVDIENTVATALDQRELVAVRAGGLQVGGGLRLTF
ncbi:MAG: hypothetical protein ABIT71_13350 [Vicinamibacteraceae bacterium]